MRDELNGPMRSDFFRQSKPWSNRNMQLKLQLTIRTVRQYGATIREIYHPSSNSGIKPTTNTIV